VFAELADGRFDAAREHATEARRLAEATTQSNCRATHLALLSWIAAAAGSEVECRALAQEAHHSAAKHNLALPRALATAALGELELSLGRRDRAFTHFDELWRMNGAHLVKLLAAPSMVEAALRAERRDIADEVLDEVERWIDDDAPAGQRGLRERCRALVADDADRFADAVRFHAQGDRVFDTARTQLLFGESLRRARSRREARVHLQAAFDAFERLGAPSWAARAQRELRGSGATARRSDRNALDHLTPQELQVARLVAGGATNKQVAAQLYLSPRTIDFHLRNIFSKLGITSRFQLSAFAVDAELAEAA